MKKIRSGALILHICASLMVSFDITVPLWIYLTDPLLTDAIADLSNSDYINTELAIETLTEALKKEKPNNGILLHSDQGVQYTSWEFVNFCKDNGVIQSMSKAGCPYDNAPMERFYNTFKNCFYYRYTFESVEQLDEMTKQYINWYNYVRPQSTNNYMTPMEFRYRA